MSTIDEKSAKEFQDLYDMVKKIQVYQIDEIKDIYIKTRCENLLFMTIERLELIGKEIKKLEAGF